MAKVHQADKVVDPELKPEIQVKRQGVPKSIPAIVKSLSHPERTVPPVLPRKAQGRAGARRILDLDHNLYHNCSLSLHQSLYQNLKLQYHLHHYHPWRIPSRNIEIYVASM